MDVSPEELDHIINDVGDSDPEVRRIAQLRIKNLPAPAYEAIGKQLASDDIGPETKIALRNAARMLSVRYTRYQQTRQSLEWQKRTALDGYDRVGTHSPKWDDAARAALTELGERRQAKDELDAAEKVAAFRKAIEAGCNDPLIVTLYTRYQLESVGGGYATPATIKAQLPEGGLAPGTARLMKTAAEAMATSHYSTYFKCRSGQTEAWLTAHNSVGGREPMRKQLDASFTLLPFALKTPGCPADLQMQLVVDQYHLEVLLDKGEKRLPVFHKLFPVYSAAAKNSAGPLLFKGQTYIELAYDALGEWGDRADDKHHENFRQKLTLADGAFQAAWKMDPSSWQAACGMIAVRKGLKGDAQDVDTWFTRAIEIDPDNYDACVQKMNWLLALESDSRDALLTFGHECLRTENFRGRVGLLLVQIHLELAKPLGNPKAYLRQPGVWEDIRTTYESCLAAFPDSAYDRSVYARLAWLAGQYADADAQFGLLGEKADLQIWGTQEEYDRTRLQVAKLVHASAPTSRPTAAGIDPAVAQALALASLQPDMDHAAESLFAPLAAKFPALRVLNTPGKADWNEITLNNADEAIDCVRFHTPKGGPRDMRWIWVMNKRTAFEWNIMSVEKGSLRTGAIPGWETMPANEFKNLPVPRNGGWHHVAVAQVPAEMLEPDKEYLIWFRLHGAEPVPAHIAITFVPPRKQLANWNQLLNDLGL